MLQFNIEKSFQAGNRRFSLQVEYAVMRGTFLGIVGPSGSGKSTLLRCLAGLARPDGGYIRHDGEFWYHESLRGDVPARKRNVGFVFQDYALFPHLTVRGNILFANPDRDRAAELLGMTHLTEVADQFPRELSGGQQQRTALARALARRPELLLLDEPLSALDEDLRYGLGGELRDIQKKTGVTAILVTHSRAEVNRLCDEVLELKAGRLVTEHLAVY